MRDVSFLGRTILIYAGAVLWVFGWLTAVFGLWYAFLATIIIASPLLFMVQMSRSDRPTKRREFAYLAVLVILALVGARFLVSVWDKHGLDRPVAFKRDIYSLRRYLAAQPEYAHVTITGETGSGFKGQGLHVVLSGSVRTRKVHGQLVKTVNRAVRYATSIKDEVTYRGKNEKGDTKNGDSRAE